MKRVRQYIGILAAAAAYYSVHEGAHLLCAVLLGTFKEIRFMGIGMQIDVYAERMTDRQLARKKLLDYSLEKAAAMGFGAVLFEGNIGFYGHSGFTYARNFGI